MKPEQIIEGHTYKANTGVDIRVLVIHDGEAYTCLTNPMDPSDVIAFQLPYFAEKCVKDITPPDPRDAEIARLRDALEALYDHVQSEVPNTSDENINHRGSPLCEVLGEVREVLTGRPYPNAEYHCSRCGCQWTEAEVNCAVDHECPPAFQQARHE